MKINIPDTCPSCSSKLVTINTQLYCTNAECPSRSSKYIEHFAKSLGIKGLGSKTIEALSLESVGDIYNLTVEKIIALLGSEKIAVKLMEEIEKSKKSELSKIITSFGIPLIGETASRKLVKVISSIDDINEETCSKAGLGEKATNNIIHFLEYDFISLRDKLPFKFTNSSSVVQNSTNGVCITGKVNGFKTKADVEQELVANGFTITNSVTKETKFLIDEVGNNSSKRVKADSLGITVISDFKKFIGELNNE